jgi:dipeptidyl-peptidase 4
MKSWHFTMANRIGFPLGVWGCALAVLAVAGAWVGPARSLADEAIEADSGRNAIASMVTVAERSKFLATSREADVQKFLEDLDAASPHASLVSYGQTFDQRPLWALILSREESVQLPLPDDDPRLVITLLGNIHSGECDGKEALLALARDVLAEGVHPYLEQAVIVVAPNFNADGNERVGPLHRPGQEGPALGMGTRENAIGQDLNRDFVKLDSPEVRSLVRMLDAWDVDVLIDAHTTNGSLHRYDMTYDVPHNPAANPEMIAWMRGTMLPAVSDAMTQQGMPIFYYGNFNREHTVWESYGFEPRYSTEYMGLRGKMGILAESYSYASYERRIAVSYAFIEECLSQLTRHAETLQPMLNSQPVEPPKGVAIQGKIVAEPGEFQVSGYAFPEVKSPVQFPTPKDRDQVKELTPKEYPLTLVNRGQATLQVDAPKYYFIPEECSWPASRIRLHGIPMLRVEGTAVADVQRYRIRKRTEANEYQMRRMSRYEVDRESESMTLGSGWLVPTDQTLGVLATYLLEPHSDESLASWGFFDPALREASLYPVVRLNTLPEYAAAAVPLPKLPMGEMVPKDVRGERLTLEKLFDPKQRVSFSSMPAPLPKWLPDGESYLMQRENRWYQVDAATGAMQPFRLPATMVEALGKLPSMADGAAAPYGRQLNIFDDAFSTALIRHKKDLILYDVAANAATQLTDTPELEEELAELSPSGNHVAFVRDQNLWVVDCKTRELKALTEDGGGDTLNGKLDWVYQEEVYGRGQFKAYWWNSDGTKIAYLKLDESPVPNFVVDNSLSTAQEDSLAYAQKLENMRYPKAGQNNPNASLHVVDVATGGRSRSPSNVFRSTID